MPVKKALQDQLLAEDVLAAILAEALEAAGGEELKFVGHDYVLQGLFYDLVSSHPELGNYFVYSTAGYAPYSPMLNEAVADLQLGGLVGRENPEYEIVFVKPTAREYYNKVLKKRLSRSELKQEDIRAAADDLLRLMKEDGVLKDDGARKD